MTRLMAVRFPLLLLSAAAVIALTAKSRRGVYLLSCSLLLSSLVSSRTRIWSCSCWIWRKNIYGDSGNPATMTSFNTGFPRERPRSPVKTTSTPNSPELQRKMSLSDLRKMSESASDAGMGIPYPPSAADLRPNAYPYLIATTATGVLSRAHSLSSPANGGKHHYVPPSHAREGSFGFDVGKEGSGKDGKDSNRTGKGREER
ncbi:hypothetical protein K438DRAFT_1210987 [Mycena galopus ATCC 62051]|nr:hypothetical protein K438DRAFT_1210987 [Mycena galopus ATCC 62051]